MSDHIHDAFDSIKAKEELKKSTKQYLVLQREKQRKIVFSFNGWKLITAACAMFALVIGIGGYSFASQTPVSYISIDINPSIELEINRFDKVISETAYNEAGAYVVEKVPVKGKFYKDAVNEIVESEAMKSYLNDEAVLSITVASDNSRKETEIMSEIHGCTSYKKHCGQSHTTSVTNIQEAHNNGLSFGKYSAYLTLSQYDNSVTTEDCKNMSMKELRSRINEYRKSNKQHTENGSENHGNSKRRGKQH